MGNCFQIEEPFPWGGGKKKERKSSRPKCKHIKKFSSFIPKLFSNAVAASFLSGCKKIVRPSQN